MAQGACAGLCKSLHREWEQTRGCVVDVDPEVAPATAAKMVADELAAGDGALEVFRDEGMRRIVMLATNPPHHKVFHWKAIR